MGITDGLDRRDLVFAPETPCGLCGTPSEEHGSKHHNFVGPDDDPGAAVKPPEKKKDKPAQPTLIVAPAPDIVLRQLLLRKGIITSEEVEAMERELTVGVLGIKPPSSTPSVFAEPPANS